MIEVFYESDYIHVHGGRFYTHMHKLRTKFKCAHCKEEIKLGDRYWTKEKGKEIHIECLDWK